MSYRMLLADLDGTVLTSRGEVTPGTIEAFRRARAAGWRVILATGRIWRSTQPVVRKIGLAGPVICAGGTLVKDAVTGDTRSAWTMAPEVVRRVAEVVRDAGESVFLHIDAPPGETDAIMIPGPRISAETQRFLGAVPAATQLPGIEAAAGAIGQCLEVSVWAGNDALARCRGAVEAALDGQVRTMIIYAPNEAMTVLNVFAAGVSKWATARRLANEWTIADEEIVAIGDDVNDTEMIREAGLGVAMAGASEAVCAVADRMALGNDSDGVADMVNRLLDDRGT